jgi:small GTP-binding protein
MEERYKVILLGDAGVGKTSIARRRLENMFEFKMVSTIGAAHIRFKVRVNDVDVGLMLWDTAGQEQFASLVPVYARGAQVCVIVGSIVNPDSIGHIFLWRDRLNEAGENPPIVIAINKMDLLEGAPMTIEGLKERFAEFKYLCFVSARTGDGIEQLFVEVAQLALGGAGKPKGDIKMPAAKEPSEGCC